MNEKAESILVYCWGSVCEAGVLRALKKLQIPFMIFDKTMKDYHADAVFAQELICLLKRYPIKAVFSYDYFPLLSMICEINQLPYISWIYDCPQYTLQSKSIISNFNYIFCFDKLYCDQIKKLGGRHVYHHLLGTDVEYFCKTISDCSNEKNKYAHGVSFVGNLYNDEKNRIRNAEFSDYTEGFLEGIIQAQLQVYGYNFIRDTIPDEIVCEVLKTCKLGLGEMYIQDEKTLAADAIAMEVSARERIGVLQKLSEHFKLNLYTASKLPDVLKKQDNICHMGTASYGTELPLIFSGSRININITSKSIESGIPQRVFDILACGGFCLTNYQQEIAENFVDGKELVMYTSLDDALEKAEYYLTHETERLEIAGNGQRKIKERFRMEQRVEEMLEFLQD